MVSGPSSSNDPPPPLRGLDPREVLRRALEPARLSGGAPEQWEPPPVADLARQFPGYELLDLLGRGGMGAVYRARQRALDRLVAIKILPLELSLRVEFAERFRREAQALARLAHPHIVGIYEFGQTHDGHFYFAMEYVEGSDLARRMAAGRIAVPEAVAIVRQICDALAAAHAAGFLHRDVKPSNVLLDAQGRVKVSDFGLARLLDDGAARGPDTLTGTVLGTPEYIAPEQARHGAVDERADLYSVGVIFYEMLTGNLPRGIFDAPSKTTLANRVLDKVVRRALQHEPERRYRHAREMGAALRGAGARLPRRMQVLAWTAAILVAGLAALLVFQPWKDRDAEKFTGVSVADAPFTNSLGQRFVPAGVPGVLFCVWETRVRDFEIFVPETQHQVAPGVSHMIAGKWVEHADADWRTPPGYVQTPDHPAVGIGWDDAVEFCLWLTDRERRAGRILPDDSYRLPTDAEWSIAAGLPLEIASALPASAQDSHGIYPWGTDFPPPAGVGNFAGEEMYDAGLPETSPVIAGLRDGYAGPSPVGAFRAQRHGLFDLGGNVAEWTADTHPTRSGVRLVRGGSWATADGAQLRSAHRVTWKPDLRTTGGGFRIVFARGMRLEDPAGRPRDVPPPRFAVGKRQGPEWRRETEAE